MEEEVRAGTERSLTAYGVPLYQVNYFKYLGQVLAEEDDAWPAVVRNLRRARQNWVRMTRILIREVSDAQAPGQIYLAVVQSIIMYGSETWVLTPRMKIVLGGFHHRVARRLMGRQPRKVRGVGWVYPSLDDTMGETGLQEVETYVYCRQNTVT